MITEKTNEQTLVDRYRKLPGMAKKNFGLFVNDKQRLWLADDHVLLVTLNLFTERYKRFHFSDIQAITIQKTSAGAVLNTLLLIIAALTGLTIVAGVANGWDPLFYFFPGFFITALLIAVLMNSIFGPTCNCRILTAVHDEKIFCLGRLRTAERVVEMLRTEIERVQGVATPGETNAPEASPYVAEETSA